MIKERSLILCVVLTFVTCGLYGLYWFVKLTDETNELSTENKTASGIMALILVLVTCGIYSFYWAYKTGCKVDEFSGKNNTGIVYLILSIFGLGIVTYTLTQNEINKYAEVN